MNADVMCRLDYFSEQPLVCAKPRCSDWRCEWYECRVHKAIVEMDATACEVSSAIRRMHHVTREARKEIAEATGDVFSNAACEYGADFDAEKFVRYCGVKPRAEVRS